MKRLLTLIVLLVTVYQGNSIIPKFYVEKGPQGTYRVYSPKDLIVPKFTVKPGPQGGWEVYKPGEFLLPSFRIKKGGGKDWQ